MINKLIANTIPWFPKPFIWQFSKRYVAGETLDNAVQISKQLNSEGIKVTIDLLGEFISNMDEAIENAKAYHQIIDDITSKNIDGSVSIKPTFFGLNINEDQCFRLIHKVITYAIQRDCFVRIDMEDSDCTSLEIDQYIRLQKEFPQHVGLVIQAYLKRSEADIKALQNLQQNNIRLNFRLCKGIYVEPEEIAFKAYQKIRDNYVLLLEQMIQAGNYVAIATHDRYLVEKAFALIEKYNLANTAYEFQMLYGVTPGLRSEIVAKGHQMRIYVPYGKDWFGYCTRRLKENPKMTTEIIKNLFVRG